MEVGDRQEVEREQGGGRGGGGSAERGAQAHNNENNNKPENAVKTNPHGNNHGTAIETQTRADESTSFLTNIVLL